MRGSGTTSEQSPYSFRETLQISACAAWTGRKWTRPCLAPAAPPTWADGTSWAVCGSGPRFSTSPKDQPRRDSSANPTCGFGGKDTMPERILVTGAGGFIGHHLVGRLKTDGFWVRGVDIKYPEYETSAADEFEILDLRRFDNCFGAPRNVHQVYNLAAGMGGIRVITGFFLGHFCHKIPIKAHMIPTRQENS